MASGTAVVRYLSAEAASVSTSGGTPTFNAASRGRVTAPTTVTLRDGRKLPNNRAQLRRSGFMLLPFRSASVDELDAVVNPAYYREDGKKESAASRRVRELYFAETQELIRRLTKADACFVISHAVRNGSGSKRSKGKEYLTAYATFAHCDYTEEIIPEGWKMLAKRGVPESDAKRMRVAFYNLWAPTRVPVETAPLALLDWASTDARDVRRVRLGYNITPKSQADGKKVSGAPPIAQLLRNDEHRWYIFPGMQPTEAIVFTQVDGRPGFAKHSFHTAVKHQIKPDPIPRQSIEVRFICGFLPSNPEAGDPEARL